MMASRSTGHRPRGKASLIRQIHWKELVGSCRRCLGARMTPRSAVHRLRARTPIILQKFQNKPLTICKWCLGVRITSGRRDSVHMVEHRWYTKYTEKNLSHSVDVVYVSRWDPSWQDVVHEVELLSVLWCILIHHNTEKNLWLPVDDVFCRCQVDP